jgi:hypothetical protein
MGALVTAQRRAYLGTSSFIPRRTSRRCAKQHRQLARSLPEAGNDPRVFYASWLEVHLCPPSLWSPLSAAGNLMVAF